MSRVEWGAMLADLEAKRTFAVQEVADIDEVIAMLRQRAATPKGTQLSGSVKCTNPACAVMTDYDPCRRCGVKLKRKWGA